MRFPNKITANYYFSHYVLRDLFLSDKIYEVIEEVDDNEVAFNQYLKAMLYERILDVKTKVYNVDDFKTHEFEMKIISFSNCDILFINMPNPTIKGDSYCIALRKDEDGMRYFALELSVYNGEYNYVVTEVKEEGCVPLYKLPSPSEDDFIEYIHKI